MTRGNTFSTADCETQGAQHFLGTSIGSIAGNIGKERPDARTHWAQLLGERTSPTDTLFAPLHPGLLALISCAFVLRFCVPLLTVIVALCLILSLL